MLAVANTDDVEKIDYDVLVKEIIKKASKFIEKFYDVPTVLNVDIRMIGGQKEFDELNIDEHIYVGLKYPKPATKQYINEVESNAENWRKMRTALEDVRKTIPPHVYDRIATEISKVNIMNKPVTVGKFLFVSKYESEDSGEVETIDKMVSLDYLETQHMKEIGNDIEWKARNSEVDSYYQDYPHRIEIRFGHVSLVPDILPVDYIAREQKRRANQIESRRKEMRILGERLGLRHEVRVSEKTPKEIEHEGFVRIQRNLASSRKKGSVWDIVMRRDSKTCQYCGVNEKSSGEKMHLDHIKPVSLGGYTTVENCQVLCASCNYMKGAKYSKK